MKFCFLVAVLSSSAANAIVRHEVILRGGESITGYVAEITHDSLKIVPASGGVQQSVNLDTVLYIHNSDGRLFYLAPDVRKFVDRGVGRGGVITTTSGETIHYHSLGEELFMIEPKLFYLTEEAPGRHEIPLTEIHSVRLDHTVSEYAVKQGAFAGAGITALGFFLNFKALKEFLNFSKLFKTATAAYKTGTTVIPLSTLGWVAYDYFRGERELILSPLKVEKTP